MRKLVLGSTSPFRKELLEKLHIPFDCDKPNVDETPLENESAIELVERLSIAKAKAVAKNHPDALIIGSDQVAMSDGLVLGKPHTVENAIKQLMSFSGKCVSFYTGLCLFDAENEQYSSLVEPFHVHFKTLSKAQISRYVELEQPLNCAGSFKSEGLGISLFDRLDGNDPNSLIGLPLIQLTYLLSEYGIDVLGN